jgi:hypothetical protein
MLWRRLALVLCRQRARGRRGGERLLRNAPRRGRALDRDAYPSGSAGERVNGIADETSPRGWKPDVPRRELGEAALSHAPQLAVRSLTPSTVVE